MPLTVAMACQDLLRNPRDLDAELQAVGDGRKGLS